MPLIEAAGNSVARIRPDSVKNSMPPERIWLSISVFRAELVIGENLQVEAAVGLGFDRRGHLLGADVHWVRIGKIVGVFVGEFRGLRARDQRRPDAAQNRRGSRCLE